MIGYVVTIALSLVMGFSVFLSMPLVFRKTSKRRILIYNAFAIGILVFLLLDVYGDVAALFGSSTLFSPYEIVFIVAFALAFLFFITPKGSRDPEENPKRTSILAAIGIGFQNLTEGLLLGSASAAGLISVFVISAIGFSVQNVTEGFPIATPLIGSKEKMERKFVAGVFLVSGMPVVAGTIIGLIVIGASPAGFFSGLAIVLFDALASAAILYVVLVLFHVNVYRGARNTADKKNAVWLTYAGILLGFVFAYIVNYIVVVP